MSARPTSAYEHWTWDRCGHQIQSLKHRLGYGEQIYVLGFQVMEDGRLFDPFHRTWVFDPASAPAATAIPRRYSAIPEMYCILATYAQATEISLTDQPLSLSEVDRIRPKGLSPQDCRQLLQYTAGDLDRLRKVEVPFIGKTLEGADLAFQVWPLPQIPLTLRVWQGDDEVAASGSLHFDRSASQTFPHLLSELAALTLWRLQNLLDPDVKWGYHQHALEESGAGE